MTKYISYQQMLKVANSRPNHFETIKPSSIQRKTEMDAKKHKLEKGIAAATVGVKHGNMHQAFRMMGDNYTPEVVSS